MRWVALLVLLVPARARAEPEPSTERTVDARSGFTMASERPGLALGARWFATDLFYLSGSLGASLAIDDTNPEHVEASTLLGLQLGGGVYGEVDAWTGYAGARFDLIRNLDAPQDRMTTGVGPAVAIARRIGFAWGHPIGLELSAAYLRGERGGIEVGLHFTGTLFPDRPL